MSGERESANSGLNFISRKTEELISTMFKKEATTHTKPKIQRKRKTPFASAAAKGVLISRRELLRASVKAAVPRADKATIRLTI